MKKYILIFVILVGLCSIVPAQSVIQSKACQDWTNFLNTYQCAFNAPTTRGNAIIVFVLVNNGATISGLVDNHSPSSNLYVQDLTWLFLAASQRIYYYSIAGAGSAQTITINLTGTGHIQVVLMEVNGLLSSGELKDQTSAYDNGYNTGLTFTSRTTPATTQANELLIGWAEQAYPNVFNFTDDLPWTMLQQEPLGGSRITYRTTTATGRYAYTGKIRGSGDYDVGAAIVTYKAAMPVSHIFF
jgi:hypothetical protein